MEIEFNLSPRATINYYVNHIFTMLSRQKLKNIKQTQIPNRPNKVKYLFFSLFSLLGDDHDFPNQKAQLERYGHGKSRKKVMDDPDFQDQKVRLGKKGNKT